MSRVARPLVESAILAACGTVLVLIAFYVPVLGLFAAFLSPLPAALAVIRHGTRWGLLSSAVTGLSLIMFMDLITAVALWVAFGLTGISFGFALRRNYSPGMVIAVTTLAFLVGTLADLVSAYLVTGLTPAKLADELVNAWRMAFNTSQKILGPNPMLDQMTQALSDPGVWLRVLPAAFILGALFQAYLNYEVSARVLPRIGHAIQPLPPFSRWIFPEAVGHAAIISYIGLALPQVHQVELALRALETVFIAVSYLLLLESLSLISFYLLRAGFPRFAVGIASILVLNVWMTGGPFALLMVLLGLADVFFDFRRIRQ